MEVAAPMQAIQAPHMFMATRDRAKVHLLRSGRGRAQGQATAWLLGRGRLGRGRLPRGPRVGDLPAPKGIRLIRKNNYDSFIHRTRSWRDRE
jgi:hypothetical protein